MVHPNVGASVIEYYGDGKTGMVMSGQAAADYKAANRDVGSLKVLTDWPIIPNYTFHFDSTGTAVNDPVNTCGKTGEPADYQIYA